MNRRSLIAGIGALSTGSAAALGTGAFSSAEAQRSVSVQVADDASAYLAIESTSQYADGSGDAIALDFGTLVEDQDGNDLGEHVGENSSTVFGSGAADRNVFTVRNQGRNKVKISPQYQVLRFDSDGNSVESDGELAIALALGTGNVSEQAELSTGDSAGYFVQIVAGDNPPDTVTATFEINANEIED